MKPLRIWMEGREQQPGSVCCLVRARLGSRSLMMLSVAHVLTPLDTPASAPGTAIVCEFDNGEKRKVAELLDWADVRFTPGAMNSFDGAVAAISPGEEARILQSVALPAEVTGVVQENWPVSVIGARSGLKDGVVTQTQLTDIALEYEFEGGARVEIASYDPTLHFATNRITQGGDSGAPCLDRSGRLMGMLVGLSPAADASRYVYIRAALDRFGVDVVLDRHERSSTSLRNALSTGVRAPVTAAAPVRTAAARGGEADTLARTMWGEARGEVRVAGRAALEGVAWAVVNRADHPKIHWWGRTIEEVCRKPWQFSCWNKNDPNRAQLLRVDATDPVFSECIDVAQLAVGRSLPADPTRGATHYHTARIRPKWSIGKQPSAQIGNHLFYNNIG